MRISPAQFDPERRYAAPNVLWGIFTRNEGTHPHRHAPFDGIAYGEMEAHSGTCARQRDRNSPSNNCGRWYERVRGLSEARSPGCREGCSIDPSGIAYDPEARWLTLTLYVDRYDTQYSASVSRLEEYLYNAITERGLSNESLFMELRHIEAALQPHPGAQNEFTRSPQNIYDATHTYLKAHPNLPRTTESGIALGSPR